MIIYFSGTGNSKYIADALGDRLNDDVINSADYIKNNIEGNFQSTTPFIFIFPVYLSIIPKIFADFIKASAFDGNNNFYFIATCAGDKIGATTNETKLITENKSKFNFMGCATIQMPQNYVLMFKLTEAKEKQKRYSKALQTVDNLAKAIQSETPFECSLVSKFEYRMVKRVEKLYLKSFTKTKKFYATDECINCGLCERNCPTNNITMKNGKPVWIQSCSHCMACINKCPKKAIEYGKKTLNKERYTCINYKNQQ